MCTFKHLRQPLEPLPFFTGFSPSSSQSLQPSHRPPSCYSGSVRMVERAILIFNSYAPFLTRSPALSLREEAVDDRRHVLLGRLPVRNSEEQPEQESVDRFIVKTSLQCSDGVRNVCLQRPGAHAAGLNNIKSGRKERVVRIPPKRLYQGVRSERRADPWVRSSNL